jgi:hypothetical protein
VRYQKSTPDTLICEKRTQIREYFSGGDAWSNNDGTSDQKRLYQKDPQFRN